MRFNNKEFGKLDLLNKSPFYQHVDDANINPPPPGQYIFIFDDGSNQITDSGDLLTTD